MRWLRAYIGGACLGEEVACTVCKLKTEQIEVYSYIDYDFTVI